MRICHFSDWHGERHLLPKADLYVCTGDMLPNFPLCSVRTMGPPQYWRANMHYFKEGDAVPGGPIGGRIIEPEVEKELQGRWIREYLGSYRQYFKSPDAPVVVVRGNHDFTDLSEAFGGDVWEVDLDPSRTVEKAGLKVGGCRGIAYIVGEWSDELKERGKIAEGSPVRGPAGNFEDVAIKLPTDLDLLITHAPPYGIMDQYGIYNFGSRSIQNYIYERLYVWGKLKAHCFGHIHEARGKVESDGDGGIVFSNAARSHNVIDLD